ncbi:ABC transporter permease [Dehalococcoidia bacterium]|nr:ABC transporter permease [Dehalococcoidia bacterium]
MRYLVLFKAILKQQFILMRRYLFNTIVSLIGIYIIFLLIFFGAHALGGGAPEFGATLDAIVVGFLVWTFALFAYSDLAHGMVREAQEGTLEQLYMSPVGFTWVSLFRIVSRFWVMLTFNIMLLVLIMATTGRWLHLDVVSLLPLIVLTLAGVYGMAFATGGLALVFKRVESFVQILQFAVVGLIAAPLDRFPFLRYLPLAEGSRLIRRVMAEGLSIFELPATDLLFLLANSVLWFGLGFLAFKLLVNVARDRGLLGHY